MQLLRQYEDGVDIKEYLTDTNLRKILEENINKLDTESKRIALWKIKVIKRHLKSKDLKVIDEIEKMVI
jgi:nucleoside-triphosphatase THEP1